MENREFKVYNDDLVDIIIKRTSQLKNLDFFLNIETQLKIDAVQVALDEFKKRFEDYCDTNPIANPSERKNKTD